MEIKKFSIKEYLKIIKPCLKYIIINLQRSDTGKIQFIIAINFISSKDTDEERTMHSEYNNIEVMTYDNRDEVIEELFDSRYQIGVETLLRGSDFIFDCLNLL